MDCLITIEGGLGKSVMFTALLPELKTKYDNIYVVSPYVDVFKCCKDVTECFPFGQPIYEDIVLDENVDLLWYEPYSNSKFIRKQEHLFNAWREAFSMPVSNENEPAIIHQTLDVKSTYPEIVKDAELVATQLNNDFIIVQFNGGQSPIAMAQDYNWQNEPLKRNYFKAQELVNLYKEKHPSTTIIHYALKNEPTLENTIKIEKPYLEYCELSKKAKAIICTDSSLQHLVTGNCPNVTVIWGETRPEHFGYAENNNICAKNVRNSQPYFKPLGVSPAIIKFPAPAEIIESVENYSKERGIQL